MAWTTVGNIKGPKGDKGDTGDQGPQGEQGPAGEGIEIAGSVATYADLPDDLGTGDAGKGYLVQADGKLYIWDGDSFPADGDGADFQGPQGETGPAGDDGADGLSVLNGSGAPSAGTGVDGEFYIDTSAKAIYGPKTSGAWGSGTSLIGPQGETGETGDAGDPGADGRTILSGSGAPSTGTGADGDFYIDTSAHNLYGPKATTWPTGVSLVGPQGTKGDTGSTGSTGARGAKWFNGTGAPGSVSGSAAGDYYLDTSTGDVYSLS